jgi:hypothetical protein
VRGHPQVTHGVDPLGQVAGARDGVDEVEAPIPVSTQTRTEHSPTWDVNHSKPSPSIAAPPQRIATPTQRNVINI